MNAGALAFKYLTGNKCEFWQTEPDAVQGGECAAVRALQAGANAATRRFWQPKTHLFLGEYLEYNLLYRWFVGMNIDELAWNHSTFSVNHERLFSEAMTQ